MLFDCLIKESLMPRISDLSAEKGADTDQRVLDAYQMQCVAEAQEGWIFHIKTYIIVSPSAFLFLSSTHKIRKKPRGGVTGF